MFSLSARDNPDLTATSGVIVQASNVSIGQTSKIVTFGFPTGQGLGAGTSTTSGYDGGGAGHGGYGGSGYSGGLPGGKFYGSVTSTFMP